MCTLRTNNIVEESQVDSFIDHVISLRKDTDCGDASNEQNRRREPDSVIRCLRSCDLKTGDLNLQLL
jgi:hypothetical protein